MSWVSKQWRSVKKTANKAWEGVKDVSDVGYNLIGQQSPHQKQEEKNAVNAAEVSALTAEKQAEYEEEAAKGVERLRLRRRKGFSSTVLTGGSTSLGASENGKSLLGQ